MHCKVSLIRVLLFLFWYQGRETKEIRVNPLPFHRTFWQLNSKIEHGGRRRSSWTLWKAGVVGQEAWTLTLGIFQLASRHSLSADSVVIDKSRHRPRLNFFSGYFFLFISESAASQSFPSYKPGSKFELQTEIFWKQNTNPYLKTIILCFFETCFRKCTFLFIVSFKIIRTCRKLKDGAW